MSNDMIVNNIKKQIALNSGQVTVNSVNGSYGFVAKNNTQISPGSGNASNYLLSNMPSTYQTSMRTDVYNYARSVFSGQNVPSELVESLASLATYYSSQTGESVQSLFKSGQMQPAFLATVNTFLNDSLQFGYQSLNTNQNWVNNPTLHGNVAAALQPSLK